MAKNLICAVDVGSYSIKSLLVKEEKEHLLFLAKQETPSEGVKEGNIVFSEKCLNSLERNLELLEKDQKINIDQIVFCLGGTGVSCFKNRGVISVSRPDGLISQEDIERVIKEAEISKTSLNKELYDIFERKFFLDNQIYYQSPLGLKALKLEAEILGMEVVSSYLKTFEQMISEIEVVQDVIPFPLALFEAVPSEREKEIGVCVVDFGCHTSSFVLIKDGKIFDFFVLPIGSDEITKQIAIDFKISYENAEKIKIEYGDAYFRGKDKKEKLEIEDDVFVLSQKRLSQIIQKMVWEMFRQPFSYLKEIFKAQKMAGGIIFVGGGAKLKNLIDFLRHKFSFYIKRGEINHIGGFENDLSFAKTAGALLALKERPLSEKNFFDKVRRVWKKFF